MIKNVTSVRVKVTGLKHVYNTSDYFMTVSKNFQKKKNVLIN